MPIDIKISHLSNEIIYNQRDGFFEWFNKVIEELPKLFRKWDLKNVAQLFDSSFGIIFDVESVKYGRCIVKLVPPQIHRYESEKNSYMSLSPEFMCKLFGFDDNLNLLILENSGSPITEDSVTNDELYVFFDNVYKHRSFNKKQKCFCDYSSILHNKKFELIGVEQAIIEHVLNAIKLYDDKFKNKPLYLVHGDLHRFNILKNSKRIVAIDPIGYLGPIEIEFVRFIGTELEQNIYKKSKKDLESLLFFWLNFFGRYSSDLIYALYIDVVFRMHNATFECSDDSLVKRWLNVLELISLREKF